MDLDTGREPDPKFRIYGSGDRRPINYGSTGPGSTTLTPTPSIQEIKNYNVKKREMS
jgi:hypothetical protein